MSCDPLSVHVDDRHTATIVCSNLQPKGLACHTSEYIDRKILKKRNFYTYVAPKCFIRIKKKYATKIPSKKVNLHAKFEANYFCQSQDTSEQSFVSISSSL